MEKFTFVPSYSTQSNSDYRMQEAQFGDAYRQAADDGPNSRIRRWKVNFNNIRTAKAREIRAFFDRVRSQPFLWRPPAPDDALTLAVNLQGPVDHGIEKYDDETVSMILVENFSASDICQPVIFTYTDPNVALTCATAGSLIIYTLDGSTPTENNGAFYVAPLLAVEDQTITAIAIHATKLPGKPTAYTFEA